MMKKNSRIYVAGHTGLVGSAIVRKLKNDGYIDIIYEDHTTVDLTIQKHVNNIFYFEEPEYVFLAAARVGGIYANDNFPAEFIYSNLQIQTNVIHASYNWGVKKLLFLGSSCIYPKITQQPMKEEDLLSGKLEPTNESYAIAKIAGIKMCQAYNKQYGTDFISVMPTNLYGINDRYDEKMSHVIPSLIMKIHNAKVNNSSSVELWGTGEAKREFLYVDDLAEACIFLMNSYDSSEIINIGSGLEYSICELAYIIREIVEYKGSIKFDKNMSDGTPLKLLDSSKINNLGWKFNTDLITGLKKTYEDFLQRFYKIK